jgi:hypothetical protein
MAIEIDDLESETVRLGSLEYTTLKKMEATYNKFVREVESYRNSFEQRETARVKREKGFLEDEEEQLKISREHIEVNVKHVEDEKESTERGIERQTKDYQLEQDRLSTLNTQLISEIEELKRQLEEKMAEQERVSSELGAVEEKIEAVRSKFRKQLDRVSQKQEKALEERNANELELQSVRKKLSDLSDQELKIKQAIEKYCEHQSHAMTMKEGVSHEMHQLEAKNKAKERLMKGMGKSREVYQEESHKLKVLMEGLAKTEIILKKIDQDIESSYELIQKLNEKIPALEKDKKTAAAARNFLEANTLSKEIKEKKDEIEREEKKIALLRTERVEVQNREPEKMKEAEVMRKRLDDLKKDYEIWNYQIECLRIAELERIMATESDMIPKDIEVEYQYSIQKRDELLNQYREAIEKLEQQKKENDLNSKQQEISANSIEDVNVDQIGKQVEEERERVPTGIAQELIPEETEKTPENSLKTDDENTKELTEEQKEELVQKVKEMEVQVEEIEKAYQQAELEIQEAAEVAQNDPE